MEDLIQVKDRLVINGKEVAQDVPFFAKGFVKLVGRDASGDVNYTYSGKNIFTITGREWLTQLMSYSSYAPLTAGRNDRIRYIGIGSGLKPQVATVDSLAAPVSVDGTNFLSLLNIPSYPLAPAKTEITFSRLFDTNELSVAGNVTIQEAGLFTDGAAPNYAPGSVDLTMVNAATQTPVAYFTFDPFPKTQVVTLAIEWTLIIG
jgi:hypothetical protein